ncbi:MAG: sugar phosphate isomerase/epimerase family protein [Candidatus Nanohaloarchaea archaeon]
MKLAGKCPPEPGEMEAVNERGFDHVELMLRKEHLERFDDCLEAAKDADLNVASIHTPHVTLDEPIYFRKADELAAELDAFLVVHSQYMHHVHIDRLEQQADFQADYGYENNPGASAYSLRNIILDQGHDLALDTAHLFMAEENYLDELEVLLDSYPDRIDVIHLCDSSPTEDGLGFGEGEMDMEQVCQVIDDSGFDGVLVFEVMPEHQEEAVRKWEKYTEQNQNP